MSRDRVWKKYYYAEGSFTIEAAVIGCLVIICLISFIYGCLYLHDKAVLEGAAYLAAQRGRLLATENQGLYDGETDWKRYREKDMLWRITGIDESEAVEEYAGTLIKGRLFVCSQPDFQAETAATAVKISYRADTTVKGLYAMGNLIGIPQISGSISEHGLEAEEFLRLVKALTEEKQKGRSRKEKVENREEGVERKERRGRSREEGAERKE